MVQFSVRFCRLNLACLHVTTSHPKLNAVLSILTSYPGAYPIPGIRLALYLATYKIGFPGWPEPILDSVTGFGASIEKEGACTSPLFHFYLQLVLVKRLSGIPRPIGDSSQVFREWKSLMGPCCSEISVACLALPRPESPSIPPKHPAAVVPLCPTSGSKRTVTRP